MQTTRFNLAGLYLKFSNDKTPQFCLKLYKQEYWVLVLYNVRLPRRVLHPGESV